MVQGSGLTVGADRVVTGDEILEPGLIDLDGDRIVSVRRGTAEQAQTFYPNSTIVPGFVDCHVHGGGGFNYSGRSPAETRKARRAHLVKGGTTTSLVSLVSLTPGEIREEIKTLLPLIEEGLFAGIHLEGPWLSPAAKGAHDEHVLRHPDLDEIKDYIALAEGKISMVTLAPELPGALRAIELLRESEITVAIGHTNADYQTTKHAIDAGASVATHLFNAMPPLHHRAPGAALALLEDPRVSCELILDGQHLDSAIVNLVLSVKNPQQIVLITDAMAAAASSDGTYTLGSLTVSVSQGKAYVAGTETIAGSTARMSQVFNRALRLHEDTVPASDRLLQAVHLTATNASELFGWKHTGMIKANGYADFVVLDAAYDISTVFLRGQEISG
jgi:N-acetylglucosamine-6-phosphate deacetylase